MAKNLITLHVTLESKIYREIEISSEASLYKLAEAINTVFGFDFDHAFGFYDNLRNIYDSKMAYELFADMEDPSIEGAKSVKKSKVSDAFDSDGKTWAFLFDYGDEWLFQVKRIGHRDQSAAKSFWKLIKSVGDAPPQYPDFEEEDDDDRPFDQKFEVIKAGDLTVARRRDKK